MTETPKPTYYVSADVTVTGDYDLSQLLKDLSHSHGIALERLHVERALNPEEEEEEEA